MREERLKKETLAGVLSAFPASARQSLPLSFENYLIFPGLCDVHVHTREPGFSYKETVASVSLAGAHGGYTDLCAMPNLSPVPDSPETLAAERAVIARDARVRIHPYGAITAGEAGSRLSDFAAMAPFVPGFSDDGRGVQREELMQAAMEEARKLDRLIVAHCEDETLLHGGYIHDGAYARAHGHRGICAESEYRQLERDLSLVRKTGVRYHACHLSAKESVALIRRAKREGLDVSCETAPHYLLLTENDLREDGAFKMNPPLREEADRRALIEGVLDGTIDMIATDHAPHSQEEKSRGLAGSLFGITGLETAFPVLYTRLVRTGILTASALKALLCDNPRRRFGLPERPEDFAVFEVQTPYRVSPEAFFSKGKSTPFAGWEVYGQCVQTVMEGKTVWKSEQNEN